MTHVIVQYREDLDGAQWTVSFDREAGAHVLTLSDKASGALANTLRLLICGEHR